MGSFVKASKAAESLGLSSGYMRKTAANGGFPDGSVLVTPSGHYLYDIEIIKAFMLESYKRQTKISRLKAS